MQAPRPLARQCGIALAAEGFGVYKDKRKAMMEWQLECSYMDSVVPVGLIEAFQGRRRELKLKLEEFRLVEVEDRKAWDLR